MKAHLSISYKITDSQSVGGPRFRCVTKEADIPFLPYPGMVFLGIDLWGEDGIKVKHVAWDDSCGVLLVRLGTEENPQEIELSVLEFAYKDTKWEIK